MKYWVKYHKDVSIDIQKISPNIKIRIRKAIEERLLVDPLKYGAPLRRSLQGYRKLRVGDYRVIYKMEENEITILKIGHRKEVYKKIGDLL